MSNYTPIVAYGPKDSLSPGDPNKVIHGTQQDAELQAIATAIATKYDSSSGVPLTGSANTFVELNSFAEGLAAAGPGQSPAISTALGTTSGNYPFVGLNVGWNGTDYVTGTDGSSNGGVLIEAQSGGQNLVIACIANTGGTAQSISTIPSTGVVITPHAVSGYSPTTSGTLVDMTPDKGSFTGTFSGYASSPTATVYWARSGNFVTLLFTGGQGTSNADNFAMSGLPSYLYPATTKLVAVPGGGIVNSSATVDSGAGRVSLQIANSSLSGLLSFFINGSGYSWATSGTKGIASPTEITYTLL